MAMMVGGMMIHGIIPGPQVMEQRPGLFWGMIASGRIVQLDADRAQSAADRHLGAHAAGPLSLNAIAVLFFCWLAVYSLNNSANAVLFAAFFGVVGYLMMKLDMSSM